MSATEALRAGYGVSHARDIPGVSNAGIAVPNPDGEPFAGIGITCFSPRLTHEHCENAVAIMREALKRAEYGGHWSGSVDVKFAQVRPSSRSPPS